MNTGKHLIADVMNIINFELLKTIEGVEENKSFEELGFTRDFGEVTEIDAKELVKNILITGKLQQ